MNNLLKRVIIPIKKVVRFVFVYRSYVCVYIDLKKFLNLEENEKGLRNIKELKTSDIELISKIVSPEKLNIYKKWFTKGYRCMAVIEERIITSYLWFSTKDTEDQGDDIFQFKVPISKGEAYIFDGYSLPSIRRRKKIGIRHLLKYILNQLAKENMSWGKILYKKPSITENVVKKIGHYKIAGRIKLTQVLGFQTINLAAIKWKHN